MNLNLRAIPLALALTGCLSTEHTVAEPEELPEITNLVVFGDSLSSENARWAGILSELTQYTYIKNHAQSGLSVTDLEGNSHFTVPDWFKCTGGPAFTPLKVIYFLGHNDGRANTPVKEYEEQQHTIISKFEELQCDVTYINLVGGNPTKSYYYTWEARKELTAQIYADRNIVPLDLPFEWRWTDDGLHPNIFQSWVWANYIKKQLELI